MRARMALWVAGVRVELREVSLKAKPHLMLVASPKGTVPVLVLPGGRVIDESLDIMVWARGQADPHGGLHSGADGKALIVANDGPFKHHLDRAKYPHRYTDSAAQDHYGAALALLVQLEARLSVSSFLCGPHISFADVAILPFIRQFARLDAGRFAAEAIPNLRQWLAKWEASAAFAAIMVKVPLWSEGSDPCRFP